MVARMRALPDELPSFFLRVIPIHRQTKSARVATGVVVPVNRPFFGTMGVAPLPVMGRISSSPPGVHTGNIDNKDLVAGTTLFTRFSRQAHCFQSATATLHRVRAR